MIETAFRLPFPCRALAPTPSTFAQIYPSRIEIENVIEALIDMLDGLDDDPDLEPSLGSLDDTAEAVSWDQRAWAQGPHDDREMDTEL